VIISRHTWALWHAVAENRQTPCSGASLAAACKSIASLLAAGDGNGLLHPN
jgi:hypothetical protein